MFVTTVINDIYSTYNTPLVVLYLSRNHLMDQIYCLHNIIKRGQFDIPVSYIPTNILNLQCRYIIL